MVKNEITTECERAREREGERDFQAELKDRTGNVLVLNVSGPVALALIGEESGVSCWVGSTLTHTHTETYTVVFTLFDRRAWGA